MSITAVGVRLDLDGPRPVAPPHSLLETQGVVVDSEGGRAFNGVNVVNYPLPAEVEQWDPCGESGTVGTKDQVADRNQDTFDPVAIYLAVECSTFSLESLKEMAGVSLEAGSSRAVESLLISGNGAGVDTNTNPFFGDANVTTLGGGAVAPREGLAYLEDFLALHYGGRGMVFATPGTVDQLSSILEKDDTGTIYTAAGTKVISAGGAVNAHPFAVAAPSAGQQYAWAVPPVEVRITDVSITDLVSSLDRDDNTVRFIAERFVLATYDSSVAATVLIDWGA